VEWRGFFGHEMFVGGKNEKFDKKIDKPNLKDSSEFRTLNFPNKFLNL
jgi:hypothetical protein